MVMRNGVAASVCAVLQVSACSLLSNSTTGTANGHKTNNTPHYVPWNHFYSVRIFENTMERSYWHTQ